MNAPAAHSLFARYLPIDGARRSLQRYAVMLALAIVALVSLYALGSTYQDVRTYAGVDLRNRVVGARVMLAGYDPYTFVWQEGMPEEWLDPVYDAKAHRLTISPPTLLGYGLIAPVPYATQRLIHFVLEWLALIASIVLLTTCLPDARVRILFLLIATFFFVATDIWRLHVERGQIYVFQLLALSIAIYCSRCGQLDSLMAGVALGMLGLMRPNLLVFAPALLVMRQWRSASALLTTVGAGVILTCLFLPASGWQSYLDVGQQYYRAIQAPDAVPDRPRPVWNGWAEGTEFDQALRNVESSSFAQAYTRFRQTLDLPALDIARASKLTMLVLAALLLFLLARTSDRIAGFALMIVLGLDTEFFLPHRWGYADLMLLAPLALFLPRLMARPASVAIVGVGLLAGPLGQLAFGLYAATLLRSWIIMADLTCMAFCRNDGAK